ncbi:DNA primase small subunit [Histomonas meleagridis]|uniref:DNA primase small subunit n=1 Tax=Histomonas meleagridis TaxID=135588 RepID=UPI00355A0D6B|nr:DNA primase small subunit [Histomonas meleagridis]KAH0805034.1 DNA primase small subunit [Histomonas meleagridis]
MAVSEAEYLMYYQNYFPFEKIREWISYNGQEPLDNRECSFWFDDQRFTRWNHIDQLPSLLSRTPPMPPQRMEIGPVYTHPIQIRNSIPSSDFHASHRELVFDIDADDFKEIKHCCGDSEICEHCWLFMECALKVLSKALKENFGFKNILYVFSGRRGVHLWVCDKNARELNEAVRRSIVRYLNLKEITEKKNGKFCPLACQMLPICEDYFCRIAEEQNIFTYEPISKQIEDLIGRSCYQWLMDQFRSLNGEFPAKWNRVKETKYHTLRFGETENFYKLIYYFTFPRLDANVTTIMNHLLKSPFSIHPKSGLLSVPIPENMFDQFPPNWVPSLKDLLSDNPDALATFKEAVELFENFQKSTLNE